MLEIKNLEICFTTEFGLVHAVNNMSFSLEQGDILGLVGESGSGKSVSMLTLLGLIPTPPGKVINGSAFYFGQNLLGMSQQELSYIRGSQISMIFQDPMTTLNPVLTIGQQLASPLQMHLKLTRAQANHRAVELLELVGLSDAKRRINNYPHQFSGGMRQRVMIAMALACTPSILIADEPTTALDVTVQAQILELVRRLQDDLGMAIIWISHDLGVVADLAKKVLVMYGGMIVEEASVYNLYTNPHHPYTIGLLESVPKLNCNKRHRLSVITGQPSTFFEKPNCCPFVLRCKFAIERCRLEIPLLEFVQHDHRVACWVDVR